MILKAVAAAIAYSVVVIARPIVIPEGTKIRIRLEERISSGSIEEGQAIRLGVADDIKVNQLVAIPLNSVVNGTITEVVPKRILGRTGTLDFSIDTINAPDGGKIPVRYTVMKQEGGSHAVRTGIITALVALGYWPAAPLVLLTTGKDVKLNRGLIFQVFTDTDYVLKPDTEENPDKVFVIFESKPTMAEIEIDGKFRGTTRQGFYVSAGTHLIRMYNDNACWERDVEFETGMKYIRIVGLLKEKGCPN